MDITYLNQDLLELDIILQEAFSLAEGLSTDQMRACRWLATGMPSPATALSATQKELLANLEGAVEQAGEHGLQDVVGWCMAAAQDESVCSQDKEPGRDIALIGPVISEFAREHAPPPASVLDVASGAGRFSLPLASAGYEISLLDPAASSLRSGLRAAEARGVGEGIRSLICGTFEDLEKIEASSYDLCSCLRATLYAHPREQAKRVLFHLSRIASRAVVVDVASKLGLVLQLGAEFEVSVEAIQSILATGTTPPTRAEHGRIVYSCFSTEELRGVAKDVGLEVSRIMGFGISETIELGSFRSLPTDEALGIETLLQPHKQLVDSSPHLLALCVKRQTCVAFRRSGHCDGWLGLPP